MAIIFILSSQSDIPGPPDPLLDRIFKKSAHAIGYGMLAISYAWALAGRGRVLSFALCLTILYAISDEWHQTFVPNRFGSPLDVLIDSVGASVGLYVWSRTEQANRVLR